MRFDPPFELGELEACLPEFLEIAGDARWWKRMDQLYSEGRKSPYTTKIMADHHWLELELSTQMDIWRKEGRLAPEQVYPQHMSALLFAGMTVETHRRLTARGRANLAGRLRDALKTGFAGLYIELDVARGLLEDGYCVEFPDLEGTAPYDLRFEKDGCIGKVECKSLSTDAGRKIHRSDFYRFMDALAPALAAHGEGTVRRVALVTLDDRMAGDDESQRTLRAATLQVLAARDDRETSGPGFAIQCKRYTDFPRLSAAADAKGFYRACTEEFGPSCHVAGVMTETGGCLVVVRSRREDDHSKPQLQALKKAASQLSGENPGFIAVQFEDIEPRDLALSHLRRRAALLANYVFSSGENSHLAAVYHTAYDGLHAAGGRLAKPAFVVWNPRHHGASEGLPFQKGLSNSEFARNLGVDLEDSDPDGPLQLL